LEGFPKPPAAKLLKRCLSQNKSIKEAIAIFIHTKLGIKSNYEDDLVNPNLLYGTIVLTTRAALNALENDVELSTRVKEALKQ
jgi:hypothetical protein